MEDLSPMNIDCFMSIVVLSLGKNMCVFTFVFENKLLDNKRKYRKTKNKKHRNIYVAWALTKTKKVESPPSNKGKNSSKTKNRQQKKHN